MHHYQPTDTFTKKLAQLQRFDPIGYKRIKKTIQRLVQMPQDADDKMHGLYNGRLKKYVGKKDYRIIYYWCNHCRKENKKRVRNCADCIDDRQGYTVIPNNSVIFSIFTIKVT